MNESGVSCAWKLASENLSKKLDRQSLDANKLTLAKGVVLRFTRNGAVDDIKYSQGQLCICSQVPEHDDDRLQVLIPPPGFRSLSKINVTTPPLDWKKVYLYREYGYDIAVGSLLMRRKQFPVVNHVSCTLHRALGLTLNSVTSRIASPSGPSADRHYCLWEKQQLLVLLSRVPSLDRITLINTETEIRDTITYLLNRRSLQEGYVNHVMKAVSKVISAEPTDRIIIENINFRPRRVSEVYLDDGGCVYMLISTRTLVHSYVGQTMQLSERVDAHNRGSSKHASVITSLFHLRPWFVGGIIVGIPFKPDMNDFSRAIRHRLEDAWHRLISPSDVPAIVLSKGKSLINVFGGEYPDLKFIDFVSESPMDV
ncbi:hypothetical protein FOZ62_018890 [Perkinsus olseni]|uniref:GIY-YIG domain-containing protein n=1 Tax=Perkinsus olseni TaxID=32597 RepID=A0A7J6THN1_PEROL|nr:hypothetical protein FOZ62_018890 [Perkinsus olseni]